MEVGAVKHQLNNEIIQLKKKLNQAKVQIIHKLTRKAQALKSQKKCPDHLKAKLQRKADAAVEEVLLLKKVRPKDLIRFAITHKGKLLDFINKPTVNDEKAYAKILLHKAMQEKYQHLRQLYSNMPVDQLLMTRKERLALKKTTQDSKNNKKTKLKVDELDTDKFSGSDEEMAKQSDESNDEIEHKENECSEFEHKPQDYEGHSDSENESDVDTIEKSFISENFEKPSLSKSNEAKAENVKIDTEAPKLSKPDKIKAKKSAKNKIKPRKKEVTNEESPVQAQVVDSFFLTESGDKYITLTEPRAPDEVKEDHIRGNRRMRRAEQFGKPIRSRKYNPRKEINFNNSRKEINSNKYEKPSLNVKREFDVRSSTSKSSEIIKPGVQNTETLHPSWEAKKQKSGIVAFQGKKVVFS